MHSPSTRRLPLPPTPPSFELADSPSASPRIASSRLQLPPSYTGNTFSLALAEDEELLDEELPRPVLTTSREKWERAVALFVACLLSIGSHYGSYLLGPIKSRLKREMGQTDSQFSLLLAALTLNNTWTPLVGGILTARLGTPLASIIATSLIFGGQLLVLLSSGSGDGSGSVKGMAFGLWVFGLGVSPLAVVQETIIVRYFSNHGLGVSLALGLVAGKGASFVSSITSFPLSEKYGSRGPFVVSSLLAGLSLAANVFYIVFHARLHPERGDQTTIDSSNDDRRSSDASMMGSIPADDVAVDTVYKRRRVRLMNLSRLGDTFWIYISVNVFSGAIWSPFLHLASNLIQRRYQLPDAQSANYASLLLAGSIFLYPLTGIIHDWAHMRAPDASSQIVFKLLVLASILTLGCFIWLALPPAWTLTPVPAMALFGLGHGFATLLLVLVVPGLVAPEWISTALGAHKSMEAAATTLSQTLSGLLLDTKNKIKLPEFQPNSISPTFPALVHRIPILKTFLAPAGPPSQIPPNSSATFLLIFTFLCINILQLGSVLALWRSAVRRCNSVAPTEEGYSALPKDNSPGVEDDEEEIRPVGSASTSSGAAGFDNSAAVPSEEEFQHRHQRAWSTNSRRPLLYQPAAVEETSGEDESTLNVRGGEERRGKAFFLASIVFVLSVWATFVGVSLWKLG